MGFFSSHRRLAGPGPVTNVPANLDSERATALWAGAFLGLRSLPWPSAVPQGWAPGAWRNAPSGRIDEKVPAGFLINATKRQQYGMPQWGVPDTYYQRTNALQHSLHAQLTALINAQRAGQ